MTIQAKSYKSQSFRHFLIYLAATLGVLLLYLFLISEIVDKHNAYTGLISHGAIGLFCVVLYSQVLLRDYKMSATLFIAYIFYAIFGYLHYTTFVDPQYLFHPSFVVYTTGDYPATAEQISIYIDKFDYTHSSIRDYAFMPHPELYALLSVIYKISGNFILTIIPINCFFRFISAISVAYIVKVRNSDYRVALCLGLVYVLLGLSSQMGRYSLGLFLITFITTLFVLSSKFRFVWVIVMSYIYYLMREPYVLVPFGAYILYEFFKAENKNRSGRRLILIVVTIFIAMATASYFEELLFENESNLSYLSSLDNVYTYLLFPVKYFIAIVGAFPWTYQHFFGGIPEFTHYITTPFNSCMAFYVTLVVFPYIYKKICSRETIDYLAFIAILIMALAVMSSAVNLGYTIFGFLFFIPTIVEDFKIRRMIKNNEPVKELLDDKVYKYIIDNNLYKE